MSSRFPRGNKLYAKLQDVEGEWHQVATGFNVGQEEACDRWIAEREREVERERKRLAGQPIEEELTLTQWTERWAPKRTLLDRDGNNDYGRLRTHVLPRLGHLPIASITAAHLIELFETIRTTPLEVTGKPPAPRTVHNVYAALRALFKAAVKAGKVTQTPCILDEAELGVKVDATPGWRDAAVFDRAEAQTLISTPKIPWDRRVAYAIELLAGLRPGENAVLRWSHWDTTKKPLGGLFVIAALNTKRGTLKRTKTNTEKWVPVHPTLAAILAEWKLSGWAEMMGRPPTLDDLIVPMPPADAAARTKRSESDPFRTTYYSYRRWNDEDLPALGWRDRRHYDMRATFVTILLDDGGDLDIIERRITHTKKSRSAIDFYNRGKQWELTCAELVKLRVSRVPDVGDPRVDVAIGDALGAAVVQSEESAAMSASSGLRRRVSKTGLHLVGATSSENFRGDTPDPDAPCDTGLHQTAPTALKSSCDLGIALLRASIEDEE